MKVALLQLPAFAPEEQEAAWRETLRRIDQAAGQSADLVVLPEGAYRVEPGAEGRSDAPGSEAEWLAALGERAKRHGCRIAAGAVLPGPGGRLRALYAVLGGDGAEAVRSVRTLGRPDAQAGHNLALVDVDGVLAGILAADDLDAPASAAACAAAGARLLLAPGASPVRGRSAAEATSDAVEFLLPARAVESGCWVLHASKSGVERGRRGYAGRSGVIDGGGRWVVQAPPDQPGIVVYDLDPAALRGAPAARPALPAEPQGTEGALRSTCLSAAALEPSPSAVELFERIRRLAATAAEEGAALLVLPDLAGADRRGISAGESLPLLREIAARHAIEVAVLLAERAAEGTYKTLYLVAAGGVLASHRQSVLAAHETAAGFLAGDAPAPVVAGAAGRLGLLAGAEGTRAGLAAILAARGAEAIAWCTASAADSARLLARARAHEAGVPLAAAGLASGGGARIVAAGGAVIGETFEGETMLACARVPLAAASRVASAAADATAALPSS